MLSAQLYSQEKCAMSIYTQTISATAAAQMQRVQQKNTDTQSQQDAGARDPMNPEDVLADIDAARTRLIGSQPIQIPPELKIADSEIAHNKTLNASSLIKENQNLGEIHNLSVDRVMDLIR